MTVETGVPAVAKRPVLASEPLLLALDALACAALALVGAALARLADPVPWLAGNVGREAPAFVTAFLDALAGHGMATNAIALPLALVGPLGAGIERGRAGPFVRAFASLGAAMGAAVGAWWLGGIHDPAILVVRAGVPLALGPFLAKLGARFHRPEEAWRAEARLQPPDATPPLALKIARARLPLLLRIAMFPVGVALLPIAVLGLVAIRCYQLAASRFLPPQCRFEPSCSRYGFQAIFKLGALKGFLLTAFRLARCQPFCRAGHDPVPDPGLPSGKERG